ncbi:MAG TPA: VanZ family protein, partial [Planctomycetota bacterium]
MNRFYRSLECAPFPVRLALALLAAAAISATSSLSGGSSAPSFVRAYVLNLGHAPLFGALAVSLLLLAGPGGAGRWPVSGAVFLAIAAVAVLDEWHQAGVHGRDSSWWDFGTDLLGAGAALGTARLLGGARSSPAARHRVALAGVFLLLWALVPVLA